MTQRSSPSAGAQAKPQVEVELTDPSAVPTGAHHVLEVVLSEPPYELDPSTIERRLALWAEFVQVPGFRVATARADGELVGCAWGWPTHIGTADEPDFYGDLYRLIDEQPWAEQLVGTEIVELAVLPDWRGRGIGARLRELLLDSGPGWLLTRPGARAANVYRKRGWVQLGEVGGDVPLVAFCSPPVHDARVATAAGGGVPSWVTMVLDAFSRVAATVHDAVTGLTPEQLAWRPAPEANPIGWTVWHLSRVLDDHLADLAGTAQVWPSWVGGIEAPYANQEFGYGHTPAQVGQLRATDDGLLDYWNQVHQRAREIVMGLAADDPERIVDSRFDPPVTLAARLVSLMDEGSQHAGQVAYLRGLLDRVERS